MKQFDPKNTPEKLKYTVGFAAFLSDGVTIAETEVTAEVYDESDEDDDAPADILDGASALNGAAMVIGGKLVAAESAVIQQIKDGVQGCTYVLRFTATLSDGQIVSEPVLLKIEKYAPGP